MKFGGFGSLLAQNLQEARPSEFVEFVRVCDGKDELAEISGIVKLEGIDPLGDVFPVVVEGQTAVAAPLVQYHHGVLRRQMVDQGPHEDALAAAAGAGDQHVPVFEIGVEGVEEYGSSGGVREGDPVVHQPGAIQVASNFVCPRLAS